ncbi:MAG: M56 family metallopeptidase, partial [Planctomycetota bacterium]|nr:M56 family metallopeptidase [Planctomycetota bacterium]
CGPRLRAALWTAAGVRLMVPPSVVSPIGVLPATAPAVAPSAAVPATGVLVAVWVAGVAVALIVWIGRARIARRRLLASTRPAPAPLLGRAAHAARRLGLRRLPAVRVGPPHWGPAVCGLVRPIVVVPAGISDADLDHALLHELAHVKRRDLWCQAWYSLLVACYWFHPLVWFARSRAACAREMRCDQTVARVLDGDTPAYRASLLRACRRLIAPPVFGTAPFGWRRSAILARLDALDRGPTRRPLLRWLATAVVLGAIVAFLLPAARHVPPPDPLARELAAARAHLAAARARPDVYGCMRTRWAAMAVQSLEEKIAARP